jgi:hypothetical protein
VSGVHQRIANFAALTDIFGRWPAFRDAEVLALRLDRGPDERRLPSLELDVHLWERTDETDAQGFRIRRKHTLAALRCEDVQELELFGFNHRNVLTDLRLDDLSELHDPAIRWGVTLRSSFGVGGSFVCRRIGVMGVRPYAESDRRPAAQ